MISIIIPAYNESLRIERMLIIYADYFSKQSLEFEIIVVCDGNDNTAEIVKSISTKYNNIRLLEYPSRLGKGGGIVEGFKNSIGDIVGFVDADEAVSPEQYLKIIDNVDNNCVIASRRSNGFLILKNQATYRKIPSFIFNLIVNLLFNLNIKDTQCGAKVLDRNIVDKVLPKLRLTGFEFDVELLWRINNEGFTIKEIPIVWKHTENSSFSLKYAPKMLINLIRLRIGLI